MKVVKIAKVVKEPAEHPWFTGPVTMQSVIGAELDKNLLIRQVTYGRGVRTKFHSHSCDQILIVTAGKGIVSTDKEEIDISLGDVIFFAAGEKHWHGAAKDATFSHLYILPTICKTTLLED